MSNQQVITEMFDSISPRYDFLNHLLSFHIDKIWRRKTSALVASQQPSKILDVATGTGDLAIQMSKDCPEAQLIGIDLSEKMLELGKSKVNKKKLQQRIKLQVGDAARIPFPDNSFDAVTSAFGVRNFENLDTGLSEMFRVCKDSGMIAILEFSHPKKGIVAPFYNYYSRHILPFIGKTFSKHPTAYQYLPKSVASFPESDAFMKSLQNSGLTETGMKQFHNGIATLYYGKVQKTTAILQ